GPRRARLRANIHDLESVQARLQRWLGQARVEVEIAIEEEVAEYADLQIRRFHQNRFDECTIQHQSSVRRCRDGGLPKVRNCCSMIAGNIKTFPAVRDGAGQYRLPWTVVIPRVALGRFLTHVALNRNQVEHSRGEFRNGAAFLMRDISRHGERFQVNLGPHDGGANVQYDPTFEIGYCVGQNQKVAVACSAESGAVAIRVLVNDVIADAYMNCHRHIQSHGLGEHGNLFVREIAFKNRSPNCLTKSDVLLGALVHGVIDATSFPPQSKLPAGHVACDGLGRRADQCKFPVVDRPRTVHGNVIDQAAFHQVDEIARNAGAQNVSAHEEEPRRTDFLRCGQALAEDWYCRVLKRLQRRVERKNVTQREVMLAICQRLNSQAGTIEDEIRHDSRLKQPVKEALVLAVLRDYDVRAGLDQAIALPCVNAGAPYFITGHRDGDSPDPAYFL